MKSLLSVFLATTLAFNSLCLAQTSSLSAVRESQLMNMAENNPKQFLNSLTDAELLQVQTDLRALIAGLQVDFSKAEAKDRDRLGYKIRKWGAISTATILVLAITGTIYRANTFKGPSVDNDAVAIMIIGGLLTVGGAVVTAGGQAMVWLTPEEADRVQDKIDSLVALSNTIDQRL